VTAVWTAALAIGLLWPDRTLALFHGAPLDGRVEAVLVGVLFPSLWWLDRSVLRRPFARALIVALLALRVGGLALVQEGWCAAFTTAAPLSGAVLTIPIEEPNGVLRSWDVRGDWRAAQPSCSAVIGRSYGNVTEFPAWFLNMVDHLRPDAPRQIAMHVSGAMTVPSAGVLTIRTGEDMRVRGRIGDAEVSADAGGDVRAVLSPGAYPVSLDAQLTGGRWRFVPEWNGRSAWRGASLTVAPTSAINRVASAAVGAATTIVVLALAGFWAWSAFRVVDPGAPTIVWTAACAALFIAFANVDRAARLMPLLLVASACVPIAPRRRTIRTAFVLVGVPWLALFAARAWPWVGRTTAYSWDDWLAYQLAGARIFMHGYWLEGGSLVFDYQPLYRWISGALHVVFGDSSVGETFLDAGCLLAGAMLAFSLVRRIVGFRTALAAGAVTLGTYALGTPWYFVGRGLSEISAAGLGFATAFLLLDAAGGRLAAAVGAGVCGVLMFYARLNHLPFAIALAALLLPLTTPAAFAAIADGARRIPRACAAAYGALIAIGVALFATRTWWYTGVFSVLYGTSLKNNDTGLRLTTIASAAPWRRVAHSLAALVWMNEPPHADPRSLVVVIGVLTAVAGLCQIPRLRTLPLPLVLCVIGATLSSFLAHTHNYPGRMSIHLVPFAVAAAAVAVVRVAAGTSQRMETAVGSTQAVAS
jgi:hypothetical protein